jgi:hypothetical protein
MNLSNYFRLGNSENFSDYKVTPFRTIPNTKCLIPLTLLLLQTVAFAQGSGSNIPERRTEPVSSVGKKAVIAAETALPTPPTQKPLYVGEIKQYTMPELLAYTEQTRTRGTASRKAEESHGFYPIGWSREGRFAYLIDYAAPMQQDTHHVEFVVQNVIFNDVAYSWRTLYPLEMLDKNKEGDEALAVRNENMQLLWTNRYSQIRRKLSEYNIRQPKSFNWLEGKSFKHANEEYKIACDITSEGEVKGTLPRARLTMTCSKGKRFLFVRNNTGEKPTKVVVHGSMISPTESRAVVICEIFFEGDAVDAPRRQLRLMGFDLVNNFE